MLTSINRVKKYKDDQFTLSFLKVLLVLFSILLFISNNRWSIGNRIQGLQSQELRVQAGSLYGFEEIDGILISKIPNAHLTFEKTSHVLKNIRINCLSGSKNSSIRLYFWPKSIPFSWTNYISIKTDGVDRLYSLPVESYPDELRFQFRSSEGDTLSCSRIDGNPTGTLTLPIGTLVALGMVFIIILFSNKLMHQSIWTTFSTIFLRQYRYLYFLSLVIVDLTYTMIITHDSGHYLWLTDIISKANWSNWDPVRNIGFPAYLFLSKTLFGKNEYALLIPAVVAHVLLFWAMSKLIRLGIPSLNSHELLIVDTILFFLIILDPIVFGFYHTLLTEYIAATIAMGSVLLAMNAYKLRSNKKKAILSFAGLLLLSLLSWQLKQPYVGAAVFPLLIALFINLMTSTERNARALAVIGVAVVILFISVTYTITQLTTSKSLDSNRQFASVLDRSVQSQVKGKNLFDYLPDHYLASINYYRYDYNTETIVKTPSLSRSYQNQRIAYQVFETSETGNLHLQAYHAYTKIFLSFRQGPGFINSIFKLREAFSNSLFTISYLLLPILCLITLCLVITKRGNVDQSLLIMFTSWWTAFANVIVHGIGGAAPLDRYLFFGYPLILIGSVMAGLSLLNRLQIIPLQGQPVQGMKS